MIYIQKNIVYLSIEILKQVAVSSGYFLLRNTLYDDGTYPSIDCTVQFSPDILSVGCEVLLYSSAVASYGTFKGGGRLKRGKLNNIYVRSKNQTQDAQNGWVRAFIAPFDSIYGQADWESLSARGSGSCNKATEVALLQDQQMKSQPEAVVLSRFPFEIYHVAHTDCFYAVLAQTRTNDQQWDKFPAGWQDDMALWKYLRATPNVSLTGLWADY